MKRQLIERAAQSGRWCRSRSASKTGVYDHREAEQTFTIAQIAQLLNARAARSRPGATVNPVAAAGFAAHVVDVEVDPETGKVEVLRYTAVQDVGRAIHPSYVEGQIQGGAAQGVGWALNEEYVLRRTGVDDERQLPRLPDADDAATCR